jgi:DUF1009 family protein
MDRGPLGILACAGSLPIEIAETARAAGRPVHIVGIEGFAEPRIEAYSHQILNIGQVGGMLSSLRRAGCRELVIAGALRRPNLLRVRVDHGFFRAIGTVLRLTRGGDDSVLRRIVRFFENEGFEVVGVDQVAPHVLADDGPMGRNTPDEASRQAIVRASALLKSLGAFDMGQGAVVTADRIVAVEGVRGTDAMLQQVRDAMDNGSHLSDASGAVLVKLPKPGQELRVDLPAIGPRTVERAQACRLAGIVVAAHRALVLEKARTIAMADDNGLFLAGIEDVSTKDVADDAIERANVEFRQLGRGRVGASERQDAMLGLRVLDVLAAHHAGRATVVVGEHVQGIDASLGVFRLLRGLGRTSHWGLRVFKRRIGVLVITSPEDLGVDATAIDATLSLVGEVGLAGIAIATFDAGAPLVSVLRASADRHRLFVLVAERGSRT